MVNLHLKWNFNDFEKKDALSCNQKFFYLLNNAIWFDNICKFYRMDELQTWNKQTLYHFFLE